MAELKAVIYARYSSSSQREESIEGQIRECTAFAERNGYIDKSGLDLDCLAAPNKKREATPLFFYLVKG